MKALKDLLLTHRIPGIRLSETRQVCATELSKLLGISVKPSDVEYADGVLTLSLPPVVKSALILRAEEIKKTLSAVGVSVSQIR